jgi:putative transposase
MYINLVAMIKERAGVDVWAYCLMPNHVHLVVVPKRPDSLCHLFRNAHREYARRINEREGWQGHLWQERFHSFVMDEAHLMATVRYVELNPVRAGLCDRPNDWRWSSVHAHLKGQNDRLVNVLPMKGRIRDWTNFLSFPETEEKLAIIRSHSRTGRPIGDTSFVDELEQKSGRSLQKRKPGPKPHQSIK